MSGPLTKNLRPIGRPLRMCLSEAAQHGSCSGPKSGAPAARVEADIPPVTSNLGLLTLTRPPGAPESGLERDLAIATPLRQHEAAARQPRVPRAGSKQGWKGSTEETSGFKFQVIPTTWRWARACGRV